MTIVCLAFQYFLFHSKSFLKKINRLEIVLITSNIILLMCTLQPPPPSTTLCRIIFYLFQHQFIHHTYLILSVRTYFYLSEPILICHNLFLLIRTYFLLYIIIFICENLFFFMILFENLCDDLQESFFFSLFENKQA